MRCFSSAFSSRLGGIPGSSGCTATSSSSSWGICRSAWTGLSFGSGLDSWTTQPPAASSAAQPSRASARRLIPRILCICSRTVLLALGIFLVIDVFLPELLLQLRIGLLLRRLPQPARDGIVVASLGDLPRAPARGGGVGGVF